MSPQMWPDEGGYTTLKCIVDHDLSKLIWEIDTFASEKYFFLVLTYSTYPFNIHKMTI